MANPQFVLMYDFLENLGKGHFAVVKRAQHVISKEQVAVKIIDKTKLKPDELAHLTHEVRLMKFMRHDHVVRLFQVVDTKTNLYLILELGGGGDLYEHIQTHGKFEEPRARFFFRQLVSAVCYCHKMRIAHRDLKAENVVLCDENTIKITDFGLSNNFSPGEMMKTSCGSLAYSPPEMLLQEPYDGPAVDVWSLGVILYIMVVGVLPFQDHSDNSTVFKILDVKYTIPGTVSKDCQDLISRMLKRDIEQRATITDIAAHPWVVGDDPDGAAWIDRINQTDDRPLRAEEKEEVLRIMSDNDMNREEILASLESSDYDYMSSTFHLLAQRQKRISAGVLTADAPSPRPSTAGAPTATDLLSPAVHTTSPRIQRHSTMLSPSTAHKGSFARPALRRPASMAANGTSQSLDTSDIPQIVEPLGLSPRFSSMRVRSPNRTIKELATSDPVPTDPTEAVRELQREPSEESRGRNHIRTQSTPTRRSVARMRPKSEATSAEEDDDESAPGTPMPDSPTEAEIQQFFLLPRTTEKASRVCTIL
eukprot:m.594258 g.594258  ORF g.594258 m.594258 type:complete len:535 (+) comp58029_c0_seq1:317-1921(+)